MLGPSLRMRKKLEYPPPPPGILSLNTIPGTKLKLKLHSLIGQISKCSNCMFININENNRNERKIAENLRGCNYKITYI